VFDEAPVSSISDDDVIDDRQAQRLADFDQLAGE
jgi:hypothetical protein